MLKKTSIILSILISLTLINPSIIFAGKYCTGPEGNRTFITREHNSEEGLPKRFRIDETLNISGSAQYTPSQLPNIIKEFNNKDIIVVDLRQESHGFINDTAITLYNPCINNTQFLNNEDAQSLELQELKLIQPNTEVKLYKKSGDFVKTIKVETVQNEKTVASKNNVTYIRYAVKDGTIPTHIVVDDFVNMVKNQPKGSLLHFHCKEGQGRTTSFMAMYAMMKNKDKQSLDQILNRQIELGGIPLMENTKRAEFLKSFYKYTQENMENNFALSYSQWVKGL